MIDPITGKPYEAGKKGQILYALASEKITTTPKESTDGKSDTRRRFSNFKNNLEKFKKQGSIILPNTNGNIVAWDGKQFLLYEKDPVTSVMNEGTPKDPEEVKEIFGLYE
jgi:hypothetical protein